MWRVPMFVDVRLIPRHLHPFLATPLWSCCLLLFPTWQFIALLAYTNPHALFSTLSRRATELRSTATIERLLSLCGRLPLWPDVIATVQRLASEHPTPSFWAVETNIERCEKTHGYIAMGSESEVERGYMPHKQASFKLGGYSEKWAWKDIKRRKVKGDNCFKR